MSALRSFARREPVLLIAAFAAVVTCFCVPPDVVYFSYLDFRTLSLLFCLMTVVNGFRNAGKGREPPPDRHAFGSALLFELNAYYQ